MSDDLRECSECGTVNDLFVNPRRCWKCGGNWSRQRGAL